MFINLQLTYFLPLTFQIQLCITSAIVSLVAESRSYEFLLLDVVITTDDTICHWAFYSQGSGLALSVSSPWSGPMCRVCITLQELQPVALMLCRMAFKFSGNVATLGLENSTAKAYLCNQSIKLSLLSTLVYSILNLASKHGITLFPAHIPTHLNV